MWSALDLGSLEYSLRSSVISTLVLEKRPGKEFRSVSRRFAIKFCSFLRIKTAVINKKLILQEIPNEIRTIKRVQCSIQICRAIKRSQISLAHIKFLNGRMEYSLTYLLLTWTLTSTIGPSLFFLEITFSRIFERKEGEPAHPPQEIICDLVPRASP